MVPFTKKLCMNVQVYFAEEKVVVSGPRAWCWGILNTEKYWLIFCVAIMICFFNYLLEILTTTNIQRSVCFDQIVT